jgi:uncharacterized damage-inducible protein DinB
LFLLAEIEEANLSDQAPSKGRTVGEQFAHLHNVRPMWLQSGQSDLMQGLEKIEKGQISKTLLEQSLNASAEAISKLLEQGLETDKIKGFKPHASAFVGYLISHESHHRGQITMILKQCGHPISKKTSFGLWEWGVR